MKTTNFNISILLVYYFFIEVAISRMHVYQVHFILDLSLAKMLVKMTVRSDGIKIILSL